jgi:hypothetical protein
MAAITVLQALCPISGVALAGLPRELPKSFRRHFMKKTIWRSSPLLLALSAIAIIAVQANVGAQQYDPRPDDGRARPRDLVALQDDLNLLDSGLSALPRRHPRFDDFQRRADELRVDVSVLAERIGRGRDGSRVDGMSSDRSFVPASRAEIVELRGRIAVLRDDVENAQRRRLANGDLTLPAGTDIEVMLDSGLSSRWSNPEDPVEASTVAALRRNGRTLIPAGARVTGFVRDVRSRGRNQEDGQLRIDFDSLTPEGGPRLELRSHVVAISDTRSGDRSLRNGGLGALLGGVIGGIVDGKKGALIGAAVGASGGLIATKGEELDLPEGTLIVLRLDRPLTLPRR